MNIGSLFFSVNNLDKAEVALLKVLELKPNDTDALKLLLNVYGKMNNKEKYNQTLEILKKLYPNDDYVKNIKSLWFDNGI